jgi:hypothetical protein
VGSKERYFSNAGGTIKGMQRIFLKNFRINVDGGPFSLQYGASSNSRWTGGLQLSTVDANIVKSSRGQMTRSSPPAWIWAWS